MDLSGNILEVNEMFLSIMEYSREELLGKSESTFVAQEEITTERYPMMIESVKGGAFNSGEFKRISKSGRELWISGSYSPILDVDGNPYMIVLFAQFTTEQKERELELKSKIDAINSSVATLEIGFDYSIVSANQVFMNDFNYKRLELRNLKFDKILADDFSKSAEFLVLWDLLKNDNVLTQALKLKTKDGLTKNFMATFSPTKNLAGKVYKILVMLNDITEQVLLKEQLNLLLKEEKRKNVLLSLKVDANDQKFVEGLSDILIMKDNGMRLKFLKEFLERKHLPVFEINKDCEVLSINEVMRMVIGRNDHLIIGESLFDLLFASIDETTEIEARIKQNQLTQIKFKFKTLDAISIYLNTYVIPVELENNQFKYMVIVINEELD